MLDRRAFLKTSSAFGLSLPFVGLHGSCGNWPSLDDPTTSPPQFDGDAATALYSISLAQWSLHRRFHGRTSPTLDNLDFAATARGFGIGAIEYVNQFFKDRADDTTYLGEMRHRAHNEGVESLLIMIDGEGNLGDPEVARRTQAIDNHRKWLDAAKFLGCHAIRVNARSGGSYSEQRKLAADGLRQLCEIADPIGLDVLVENHGGLSSNGAWLANVMQTVDHPRCGTLPDFGNFNLGDGRTYDRYQGVRELMPYAKAVSAKTHDFDEIGNEVHTDYLRMMQIVIDAGYRGWVGIEYEGSSANEDDGIRKTKALLERVRTELSRS